jgi:hypothetical protein
MRRCIKAIKLDDRLTVERVAVDECAHCGEAYLDPKALRQVSAARHGHRGT